MLERKYPTRIRNKPQNSLNDLSEPMSAVSKALSKADTKGTVTKRIPALTTSRTFGPRSPIIEVDLQAFLAKCMSSDQWNQYTEEEKQEIYNSLPEAYRAKQAIVTMVQPNGEQLDDPPVSQRFCKGDRLLKQAAARFKRDLSDGYYEKAWLNKAKQAHQERLEGKFDDYLKQHTAEMFVDEEEEQDESVEDTDDGSYDGPKNGRSRKARKS